MRALKPAGTFYVFADVSAALERRTTWDLVREWLELGVAVLPGTAFGPYPEHVRRSFSRRQATGSRHFARWGGRSGTTLWELDRPSRPGLI